MLSKAENVMKRLTMDSFKIDESIIEQRKRRAVRLQSDLRSWIDAVKVKFSVFPQNSSIFGESYQFILFGNLSKFLKLNQNKFENRKFRCVLLFQRKRKNSYNEMKTRIQACYKIFAFFSLPSILFFSLLVFFQSKTLDSFIDQNRLRNC